MRADEISPARAADFRGLNAMWQAKAIAMYASDKDRADGETRLELDRARNPSHGPNA